MQKSCSFKTVVADSYLWAYLVLSIINDLKLHANFRNTLQIHKEWSNKARPKFLSELHETFTDFRNMAHLAVNLQIREIPP